MSDGFLSHQAVMPRPVLDVVRKVAQEHGLTVRGVLRRGPGSRSRSLVICRAGMVIALRARGKSFQQIGLWLGYDHSTLVLLYHRYAPILERPQAPAAPTDDIPVPDLSGEWAI